MMRRACTIATLREIREAGVLGAVLALAGCGDLAGSGVQGGAGTGQAVVGGAVVSTVDGRPISVEDVGALVSASDLAPAQALRRLQDERLLRDETQRRGVVPDHETHEVGRQALVQAVLAEEEAAVEVSEEELRAAYEKQQARFVRPERRESLHVLAAVAATANADQDARARGFISGVIRRLTEATDVEAGWKLYRHMRVDGLQVVAQRIPAVDRSTSFEQPYLDALFGVQELSVVAQPVRTSHGWHAIVVTQIHPALDVAFGEAAKTLRAELLAERRKARLDELLARLRRETQVSVAPDVGERLAEVEP